MTTDVVGKTLLVRAKNGTTSNKNLAISSKIANAFTFSSSNPTSRNLTHRDNHTWIKCSRLSGVVLFDYEKTGNNPRAHQQRTKLCSLQTEYLVAIKEKNEEDFFDLIRQHFQDNLNEKHRYSTGHVVYSLTQRKVEFRTFVFIFIYEKKHKIKQLTNKSGYNNVREKWVEGER